MVKSIPPVGPYVEGKRTAKLRPQHGFTNVQVYQVRKLRKQGFSNEEIAGHMNADIHSVDIALSALRTKRPNPDRCTINVGSNAGSVIKSEQMPGEPMWQTVDRLLTELHDLRKK